MANKLLFPIVTTIFLIFALESFLFSRTLMTAQAYRTWTVRLAASILAIAFGMQWVLMHIVALGVSVLTHNSDTPFLKTTSVLIKNHQDCWACISLNENKEKSGDPKSSITPQMLEIEGLDHHRSPIFGPNVFFLTEILMLYDPNWCANPFQLLKPPKATA